MISYLRTLERAVTKTADVYQYEANRRYDVAAVRAVKGERRVRVKHTVESKVAALDKAHIAFKANPALDLRTCDAELGLASGMLSQFLNWLHNGRLPGASAELIAFFEERKATQYTRAAKASKAAVTRNNGKRNRK